MDKGLTFLTLSLVFLWLVFDDFVGKKRLSNLATMMTPDLSIPNPLKPVIEVAEKAQEKGIETSKKQVKELEQKKEDDKKKAKEVKKKGFWHLFDFEWNSSHTYNRDYNQIGPGRYGP